MVKQYVGARYVPKFASPVEWAPSTSYEALTIVTFNNASYTSKVPVPPTVGNPANNPQYWALTGNYNAQVEQYRQETEKTGEDLAKETQNRISADNTITNNLNAEIANRKSADTTITNNINTLSTTIHKPVVLCIGDSYGRGYHGTEDVNNSWPHYLGVYSGCTVENYCISGACAEQGATNAYYGQELLNAKNAGVIPDIIVLSAGTNEYKCTNLTAALNGFISKCHEYFPNAKLFIDWNSVSYVKAGGAEKDFNEYWKDYNTYVSVCKSNSIPFSTSCVNARFTYNSVCDDNIHLLPSGYQSIGNDLANQIFGGGIHYNTGNSERVSILTDIKLHITQIGEYARIDTIPQNDVDVSAYREEHFYIRTDQSVTYGGNLPRLMDGFTNQPVTSDYCPPFYFSTPAYCFVSDAAYNGFITLWGHRGKIRAEFSAIKPGETNFVRTPEGPTLRVRPSKASIIVPCIYFC